MTDWLDRFLRPRQLQEATYLEELAGSLRTVQGSLAQLERNRLMGTLGPLGPTLEPSRGPRGPVAGLAAGPSPGLGNMEPQPGMGNILIDPMLDTVRPVTLSTSEQRLSTEWFTKYALVSGSAPAMAWAPLPWADRRNNSLSSSMAMLRIVGIASAGSVTITAYTKQALKITSNQIKLAWLVGSLRLYLFPDSGAGSPAGMSQGTMGAASVASNLTNVTTCLATLELVRNIGASEVVCSSMTFDFLASKTRDSPRLWAGQPEPYTDNDLYDIRLKLDFAYTGSTSVDVKIGLAEPTIAYSLTPDPIMFITDRVGSTSYGDGSDGDVTASGTLTRDMLYDNLNVTGTLDTAGYHIYVRGKLTNTGTIRCNGTAGGAGGVSTAGTAGTGAPTGSLAGGSNGGAGAKGTFGAHGIGLSDCVGSAGGNGGLGSPNTYVFGNGGIVTPPLASMGSWRVMPLTMLGRLFGASSVVSLTGGTGGGGGGANATNGGGGGGGGGGIVSITAKSIDNQGGIIEAAGGAGGAGYGSTCGGGGGGGGGVVLIVADQFIRGTERAPGGAGGAAGSNAGVDGTAGQVFVIRM